MSGNKTARPEPVEGRGITPENVEVGHDPGAPNNPRLVIKALITTAITAALTGGLAAAVAYDLIDIRALLF